MITTKPTSDLSFPTKRVAVYSAIALVGLAAFFLVHWRLGLGIMLLAVILSLFSIPIRLNPLTAKKINRFKHIRRGYYSFLIIQIGRAHV